MLVADGLGGLPIEPGGQDRAGDGPDPEPRRARGRGDRRPEHAGRAGDHAGLGARAPRPVRLRPAGARHRPGRARGARDRRRGRARRTSRSGATSARSTPRGVVTDRRAGRIPTETCEKLVAKLRAGVKIEGVETLVEPVREYRLVVRFRGEGLGDNVADTDPLSTGLHTLEPKAGDAGSEKTAKVAAEFLRQAKEILKDERPANFLMMRGFAKFPEIATMEEVYGLKPAAIAVYPMYRGLARLVGHDRRRARQDAGRPDGGR